MRIYAPTAKAPTDLTIEENDVPGNATSIEGGVPANGNAGKHLRCHLVLWRNLKWDRMRGGPYANLRRSRRNHSSRRVSFSLSSLSMFFICEAINSSIALPLPPASPLTCVQ